MKTNAIRAFADKVKTSSSTRANIILTTNEANILNNEIQNLLAYLVELQSENVVMDVKGKSF